MDGVMIMDTGAILTRRVDLSTEIYSLINFW
jgi:hypothetical protein